MVHMFWNKRYFDICQRQVVRKPMRTFGWLPLPHSPWPGDVAPDGGSNGNPHLHVWRETSPSRLNA